MITPTGCRWTRGGCGAECVEEEEQGRDERVNVERVHVVSEKNFGDWLEFDRGRGRNPVEEKGRQDCLWRKLIRKIPGLSVAVIQGELDD